MNRNMGKPTLEPNHQSGALFSLERMYEITTHQRRST